MQEKNCGDICCRNVGGVCRGVCWEDQEDPCLTMNEEDKGCCTVITCIPYAILLPVTLFGAGIKTLSDYHTRKQLPQDQIQQVDSQIAALDRVKLGELLQKIQDYNAKSISSRALKNILAHTITSDIQIAQQRKINVKAYSLRQQQLSTDGNPDDWQNYQDQYVKELPLNAHNQILLEQWTAECLQEGENLIFNLRRQTLRDFFSAMHNQGKKMQWVIYDFFQEPSLASTMDELGSPVATITGPMEQSMSLNCMALP